MIREKLLQVGDRVAVEGTLVSDGHSNPVIVGAPVLRVFDERVLAAAESRRALPPAASDAGPD